MIAFLVRRLLISAVLLFLVSVISYGIIATAPGAKVRALGEMDPKKLQSVQKKLEEKYHLDRPIYVQYLYTMRDLFTNRLMSFSDRPVTAQIGDRLPKTLLLNAVAIIMVLGFGIPLGIVGARWRGGTRDALVAFASFTLIALPNFFVSFLLCIVLVKYVQVPILGLSTFGVNYESWAKQLLDTGWHLFAPALVLSLPGVAVYSRYVRASMIESLGEEYIRTARAKGLRESIVYYKHALRNSLRPVITFIGFMLVGMIGGSVIVEMIFNYPGMGRLAYEALLMRDIPTLMAINFFSAALVILGNLLADILYSVVDPRVRLE